MPIDFHGDKWACEPCVRGHRSSKCQHWDRVMIRVKKPGRPLSTCPHNNAIRCSCKQERVFMVKVRIDSQGRCICRPRDDIYQPAYHNPGPNPNFSQSPAPSQPSHQTTQGPMHPPVSAPINGSHPPVPLVGGPGIAYAPMAPPPVGHVTHAVPHPQSPASFLPAQYNQMPPSNGTYSPLSYPNIHIHTGNPHLHDQYQGSGAPQTNMNSLATHGHVNGIPQAPSNGQPHTVAPLHAGRNGVISQIQNGPVIQATKLEFDSPRNGKQNSQPTGKSSRKQRSRSQDKRSAVQTKEEPVTESGSPCNACQPGPCCRPQENAPSIAGHSTKANNSSIPKDLCLCGPECDCEWCPVHPNNNRTQALANELGQTLAQDTMGFDEDTPGPQSPATGLTDRFDLTNFDDGAQWATFEYSVDHDSYFPSFGEPSLSHAPTMNLDYSFAPHTPIHGDMPSIAGAMSFPAIGGNNEQEHPDLGLRQLRNSRGGRHVSTSVRN